MTVDFNKHLLFKETCKEIFNMVDTHIENCPAKDNCPYSCRACRLRLGNLVYKSMDKCLSLSE